MKLEIGSFDRYFSAAAETEKGMLESASPLVVVEGLRRYHSFFVEHVFGEWDRSSPVQCLLAMHAFMTDLGSLRVTFSGHARRPRSRCSGRRWSPPCYAFLIGERENLESVWLNRNRSAKALKSCRRVFASAVKEAAASVQKKSWIGPGTEDWIKGTYDAAIDFGAHANPKSVWPYVTFDDDRDDGHVAVSLTSLYGADSDATSRCLVACLDYGLVIAVVLASCVDDLSDDARLSIKEMHEVKDWLVRERFGSNTEVFE